ncbi:MAG: peptidylprolyl isomerase [Terriglobia bacterium]
MRKRPWLTFALALLATLGLAAQEDAMPELERDPGLYATLETSMGKIVIHLFEKATPKTVENFVGLATGEKPWTHPRTRRQMVNKPYYDGLIFHRVIPDFMIQTGDPLGTGSGGPGFTIPDEFDPRLKFDRPGRLGMANIGQPNTGGAQFFITHRPTPHLNNKHTIFGQVLEGQDVVNAIGKVPRDPNDKPRKPVTILKVTIERVEEPPAP